MLSYGDTENVKQRFFENASTFKDSRIETILSFVQRHYCHPQYPNCVECPLAKVCYYYQSTLQNTEKKGDNRPTVIDLFAGAGGLSLGLDQSGFEILLASDYDKAACKTLEFNHRGSETQVRCCEIENLNLFEINKRVDLLVGGPPCQGFSNANRQRLSDDPRNKLYKEFLRQLKASKAEFALLENVPGMMKVIPSIREEFGELGYKVEGYKINAKDLGVPQNRVRFFLIAKYSKNRIEDQRFFAAFEQQLQNALSTSKHYNLDDAIEDLPALMAKTQPNSTSLENADCGFSAQNIIYQKNNRFLKDNAIYSKENVLFNHRSKFLNQRDHEIYSRLSIGEDSSSKSIIDINPYKNRQHIFKDKFFKLNPRLPSKTITAHMYYDCHMYIHPYQSRGLTPREAARIQGFPDDYVFFGFPNEWYRQIGNAVSPIVSKIIGDCLMNAMKL